MKLKALNRLFAATAVGFMFTNASIAANAEELPEERAAVSGQEASSGEEQELSGNDNAQSMVQADSAEPELPGEPETQEPGNSAETTDSKEEEAELPVQPETQEPENSGETTDSGKEEAEQPSQPETQEPGTGGETTDSGKEEAEQPVQPETQEPGTGGETTDSGKEEAEQPSQPETEKPGIEEPGNDGAPAGTEKDETEDSKPQPSSPVNFEQAKENLDKAKEEEERTKTELDNAQAEADRAQADVEDARQNAQKAENTLNQAELKKEEAEAEKKKADAAVSETEQTVNEAEKKMEEALGSANVDRDEYQVAQEELEEKKTELDKAETAAAGAEAEYAGKKAEAEEAAGELGKLQAGVETARGEASAAQQEQEAAQQAYDKALHEINTSTDVAKKNLDEAKAALDAAQEKVDRGSLGFFQYLAQEGSGSGKAALEILTAKTKSEVNGLGNENNWTAESWEKFASYTHIGDKNDATSLENMRRSIAFIKRCNELRMGDDNFPGLSALLINDAMMAIAQMNANWATYTVNDTFNGHSKVFNAGENLAWYLDVTGYNDPFQGWYYEEKESFENGDGGVTGHYENIVFENYKGTGFGVNLSLNSQGLIRLNCAQEFSNESLMGLYSYGESYGADEYETRFMQYYNAVMKSLSDAQAAYNAAKDAYDKALIEGGSAAGGSQSDITVKKEQLDKASARLEAAKASAEKKLESLNEAQAAYNAGVQWNGEAQARLEESRAKLESMQNDLRQKRQAYEAALQDIEAVFGAEVAEAARNLAESKSAYNRALELQTVANSEFSKAEAALAAAMDTKSSADQSLQEKTDILNKKMQALQKAKDSYCLAQANLAIAQADYDRLKPKASASHDLSGSEETGTVMQTAAGFEHITVSDQKESASRRAYFSRGISFKNFLERFEDIVKGCPYDNMVMDCSELPWFSINKQILDSLRANPDMAVKIIFSYKGKKYTFTIPAGYDLSLLQDSNGWYGFMYLKMIFGGEEIL